MSLAQRIFWIFVAVVGYLVILALAKHNPLGSPALGGWDRLVFVGWGYTGVMLMGLGVWCGTGPRGKV